MRATSRKLFRTAAVSWLALTAAGVAEAQTPEPGSPTPASNGVAYTPATGDQPLGDIIVTAQKRSERLDKVGISITAISGEALKTQQIRDLSDLANIVPGLVYTNSLFNTPVISLRGVGFYDTALAAYPTVSVYVDQVPLPFSAMAAQASLDVERLEALKGPQGILFGQNSTGGAINYVAAKPTRDMHAGGDIGFGRFNTVQGQAYSSGPLTSTLAARLAVSATHGDDWQYNYTRDDSVGKTRRLAGRLLVDWVPSDRLRAEFNINGWIDNSDPEAPQLIGRQLQYGNAPFADPRFITWPLAPDKPRAADWTPGYIRGKQRQYQFSVRADYEISDDVALTSLTSYVRYKRRAAVDNDGFTGSDQDTNGIDTKAGSFFQELRLANAASNRLRWVAGANYGRDKVNEFYMIDYSGSAVPLIQGFGANNFFANQRMKNYAAFGNIDFDIVDRLTLKAGARYTKANRSDVGCVADNGDGKLAAGFDAISQLLTGVPVFPASAPGSCVVLDEVTFRPGDYRAKLNQHNISYRFGVDFRATDQTLFFLNVAKGYKAGGFPVQGVATTLALHPVVQESVLDYEGGVKTRLFGGHLRLEGTLFYYDYVNKQLLAKILDPIFNVLPAQVNVPKSSVKGAEVSIQWAPVQGLQLAVSGDYLDATVDRYTGVNQLGQLANFDGTRMPFTPKWQIVQTGDYRWAMARVHAFGGYTLNYRSFSTSSVGSDDLARIKPYTLLDLRAGIESPGGEFRLTLWGKNVTNRFYWTNVARNNDAVVRFAGMPATYGVTLAYRY